jgi:hypothetical protein
MNILNEDEQLNHIKGLLKQMFCRYAEFTLHNGKSYIYKNGELAHDQK